MKKLVTVLFILIFVVSGLTPGSIADASSHYKYVRVSSTAYCEKGRTATGYNLGKHPSAKVIAVDPRVIPLGSKVYVPGYGTAIARDTGGAIKGKIIDVHFSSRHKAIVWGRKHMKIKVYHN